MTSRNNRKKRIAVQFVILLFLSLASEILLSNDLSYSLTKPPAFQLDLHSLSDGEAELRDDTVIFHRSGESAVFCPDVPVDSRFLRLEFEGNEQRYITGTVDIKDEGRVNAFRRVNSFAVNPLGLNWIIVPVKSNGNLTALSVTVDDGMEGVDVLRLKSLEFNTLPRIVFKWKRWLCILALFILLYCVIHFRLLSVTFQTDNPVHLFLFIAVLFVNLTVSGYVFHYANGGMAKDTAYPFQDEGGQDVYALMFDAFYQGRLYLTPSHAEEETEQLAALDNPYDNSQREGFVNYRWDYAYYNGHYYAYFGSAPVLIFYFPYYFFHHALPGLAKASWFFSCISILMLSLCILKAISVLGHKPAVAAVLLTGLALPAMTVVYMLQASADMYYLAYSAATAFLSAYVFFSLSAYKERRKKAGIPLYTAAGCSLALAIASRPTSVIPVFFLLLPLYICVLREKDIAVRQRAFLVLGYAVPLIFAAVVIMWHNNARFDSPFEFGAVYQLTVSDIHYNSLFISTAGLWSYFVNYWCRTLKMVTSFPFIQFETILVSDFGSGKYIWASKHFGVFAVPANFLLPLLPFLSLSGSSRRPDDGIPKRSMAICGLLAGAVVLYIDFCMGGVFIRYTCDSLLCFGLLSCALAWRLLAEKNTILSGIVHTLLLLSLLVGFALIFYNEREYIRMLSPDQFLMLKRIFSFGQCC